MLTDPTPAPRTPALVRIWHGNGPVFEPLVPTGDRWLLGGDGLGPSLADSGRSRNHCEVQHVEDGWRISDLGSAPGTCLDAEPVKGHLDVKRWRVLRIGRSLIVPLIVASEEPLQITRDVDRLIGPNLLPSYRAVTQHALRRTDLVLAGPKGCGFEALAANYLARLRTQGRLTVVGMQRFPQDTAQIPGGVVLVEHTVVSHILEYPEIRRALARADLRFCFALECIMNDDPSIIPEELASRCALVVVPGLERRPEEIPWWIVEGAGPPCVVDISFVEACLLCHWSGGIPDLVAESRRAAASRPDPRGPLMAHHLASDAGRPTNACLIDHL